MLIRPYPSQKYFVLKTFIAQYLKKIILFPPYSIKDPNSLKFDNTFKNNKIKMSNIDQNPSFSKFLMKFVATYFFPQIPQISGHYPISNFKH